jgi:hypothetical protein
LTVLEVVDVIGWELSTQNLGLENIISERASPDLLPVEKSFLFKVARYTFGHHQQLQERSIDQVIWI